MEELKQQIKQVNELTDQREVRRIRERIDWLNIYNERTEEIIELARKKGIR